MAGRIPERQSRKLASQLVGTPGVDLSGVKLLGELAKTSKFFSRKRQQENLAEQRTQQQAEAQSDAFRRKAVIDSRSAIGVVDFNNQLDELKRDSKDINDYSEKARVLLQENLEGIEDDELRATFSKDASKLLINKNNKFSKDFKLEEMEEIRTNTDNFIDGNASDLAFIFESSASFEEKISGSEVMLSMTEDYLETIRPNLGEKETNRLKSEAFTTYAKAAVDGLLDSNPEDIEKLFKFLELRQDGEKSFSPDEVNEISKYATDLIRAKQEQIKILNGRIKHNTATDWANRSANGDFPSEKEMNLAILKGTATEKDVRLIRKVKASSQKVFIGDNVQNYQSLLTEYTTLDTILQDSPEDVSLAQLAGFRQSVLESMENGQLSLPSGKKWLSQISPKFGEDINSLIKNINENIFISEGFWGDVTEDILTDPVEIAEANIRFQNDLMELIDNKENKDSRRLRPDEIIEMISDLKDKFILHSNQDRASYILGELRRVGGIVHRVVSYDTDGMPMLDADLTAPVTKKVPK